MLEPVTRRQRAEISEWQQSAGSARADNGAVYTLSFDNYRPDASNFALPAKGMAVELWLQCDGSGAVESITFSPVPRTKAFWRFRSPRDLAQVPGRRFECQRRRMVKYWFESLLVGVGVMFLMDGHRILLPEQPIRRRLAVFRPLAQFDGGSKDTRAVLRLPLHLLADSDRAETLAILRRRVQSCGADWQE